MVPASGTAEIGFLEYKILDGTFEEPFCLGGMQYKEIEYSILQTACPTGWRWIAQLPGIRTSAGKASSRPEAIRLAQSAIEKALAAKPAPKSPEASNAIDAIELRRRYAELKRLRAQVRQLEMVGG